ncbi:hypothetical protein ACOMHN_034197 [Nucella lapillus]
MRRCVTTFYAAVKRDLSRTLIKRCDDLVAGDGPNPAELLGSKLVEKSLICYRPLNGRLIVIVKGDYP